MQVSLFIFVMLFTALMLLFKVDQRGRKSGEQDSQAIRAQKRNLIISRKPGFFARQLRRLLLLQAQAKVSMYLFVMLCLVTFAAATLGGSFLLGDFFLGLLIGACASPLPVIFVMLQARRNAKREAEQLEELMSSVTGAYMASNSIIAAFESYNKVRLKGIDPKLRRIGPIDEFLIDVHAINPSVDNGLRKLQAKVNNRYFDDWVNMLILCQINKEMRFALQPIIKAFNDSKIAQMESETVTAQVWREYFLVVMLLFGLIPVLRLSNEVWFNILTRTFVGRLLVCVMILASLFTAFYVLHVTRPLD